MKKLFSLTLAVLIICLLGMQTTFAAVGDPATGIQPQPGSEEEQTPAPTVDPDAKAQAPLPFSPDKNKEEQIRKALTGREVGSTTIGKNVDSGKWEQVVPVFDLKSAGMRFVISAIFFIAGPLVLVMLVYSGVKLVVMPENEEEQSRTKRTLIYSAIGLLVIAFSYAIVQNVIKIF